MTTKNTNASWRSRSVLAGLGCSLFLAASPARSQGEASAKAIDLDTLVVVANRYEMPIQRVGSTVDVLGRYELGQGQETFLIDNLRHVSGLLLRNNGGPGGVFGITTRGLASNRPTVLINGIEVSNASNGEMMNLGNLFSGNVEQVEILKGPQSSLYGADALAGVISVDTLAAGGANETRLGFSYGAFNTKQANLGSSGSLGALSWAVDGGYYESDGFSAQDPAFGAEWADDDAYRNRNVSAALKYRFDERTDVYFSAYYLDAYSEFDPGVPPARDPISGELPSWFSPVADSYDESESLFVKLGTHFQIGERTANEVSIAYSDTEYLSYAGYAYRADGDRYKAEWQSSVSLNESWHLVAGASFEREDNLSDVGDRDDASVFLENLFSVSPALDLTLGGRYDDNSAYGSEYTYRGTFSYRIDSFDARVRGSYGTSFQAPSFYQLFNAFYGNRALKPEFGKGWDLGFEKSLLDGRLFASATLFGNKVNDKIDWSGRYENLNTYESEGVETSLRWRLNESFRVIGSHTFAKGEENGALEALRVPRNVYSLGLLWTGLGERLDVNMNVLAVTSQIADGGARFSGVRQPGYEVANLAAQYKVSETSSVWIRLNNVFDEDYHEVSGYETPGRNLSAGVRVRF